MNIWKTLQIEATDDITVIKKAYAGLIKQYNPEQHMEQFLAIRKAYQQALAQAAQPHDDFQTMDREEFSSQDDEGEDENDGDPLPVMQDFVYQDTMESELYADCEAMVQFRTLYFEKKCNDKNLWIRYFVSAPFLDVYRKAGFTGQLKKELMEIDAQTGYNKVFFSLLYIVYGLTYTSNKDRNAHDAAGPVSFEGIEHIYELMGRFQVSLKTGDNTNIALSKGYEDYRALRSLTQTGVWDDSIAHSLRSILDRYVSAYLYDKIPQGRDILYQTDYIPRHISALQLLNHYFATEPLPRQAYKVIWDKLDLKNATMGRNKIFYGRLREICLAKCSDLESMEQDTFALFHKESLQIFSSINKGTADFATETTEAFFQRDDLKRALRDQTFVNTHVLNHWTSRSKPAILLQRLIEYCMEDKQVALREELISRARQTLYTLSVESAHKEDENGIMAQQPLSTKNRAFFRYLFYISFPEAYSNHHSASMRDAVQIHFPYSPAMGDQLLGYDEVCGDFTTPRQIHAYIDGRHLEIVFHLFYVSYRMDDKPVYAPCLRFDMVQQMEDDLLFWVLLPLTFSDMAQQKAVYTEILKRLSQLDFLEQAPLELFADCLTSGICRYFEEEYLPSTLVIHGERLRVLYTCIIYTDDYFVQVYKTAEKEQRVLLSKQTGMDLPSAVRLGEQQLEALLDPFDGTHLQIDKLPQKVLAEPRAARVIQRTGDEVTSDEIKDLLLLFRERKLIRLELSWGAQSLVLLASENLYACFALDDEKVCRLGYLSRPDIYNRVDSQEVPYQPFLYGQLPGYLVHASPLTILNGINDIIECISGECSLLDRWQSGWAPEVYRYSKRQYNLDKILLAGYPIVSPDLPLYDTFVLPNMPIRVQTTAPDGSVTQIEITSANRPLVSESLVEYFRGRIMKLILTWAHPQPEDAYYQRKLEFLNDHGNYAMFYRQSSRTTPHILVADVETYLNVEGKYKKQAVCGYRLPVYLVHQDLTRIRGYANVLLASITAPDAILHIFLEFSYQEI